MKGGRPTLSLIDPDGSTLRRLTIGRSPSWSPDGKTIAFALGDSIYHVRAHGRARTLLVSGLLNPVVRWSPDGRKLLYTSGNFPGMDAWIADLDGTHRKHVLHERAIFGIAWRPALG